LAGAIEDEAAGGASRISKQAYAQSMPICEGLLALKPLQTRWRTSD
jgi:hypothetical protein